MSSILKIDHTAPHAHQFARIGECGSALREDLGVARCPWSDGAGHTGHGSEHPAGRRGGGGHGGVGQGATHPERGDVDHGFVVHDVGHKHALNH